MNTATATKVNADLQGRKILPPAHFPVAWANPEDETKHWTRDREHMPDPITPMFSSAASMLWT